VTKPVTLGNVEMTPQQFEQLVAEMITHRQRDQSRLIDRATVFDTVANDAHLPQPIACKVARRESVPAPRSAQPPKIAGTSKAMGVDWWTQRSSLTTAGDLV